MSSTNRLLGIRGLLLLLFLPAIVNLLVLFRKSLYLVDYAPDQRLLDTGTVLSPSSISSSTQGTAFGLQLRKQQQHANEKTPSNFTSPLCRGCLGPSHFMYKGKNVTCGELIYSLIKTDSEQSITLVEAGIAIAQLHPERCGRCDPTRCSPHDKVYMPYDEAAPPISNAWTLPISSILIQQKQVMPPKAFTYPDLKQFFSDPATNYSQGDAEKVYRWEYNPSLVTVNLTEDVSFKSIASVMKEKEPVYFYSRRVAILNEAFAGLTEKELGPCVHCADGRFSDNLERVEFGFMDANFNIIAEGVFRFEGGQDYRIFKFDGQVYFSVWANISPLWVVPRDDAEGAKQSADLWKTLKDVYNSPDTPFQIQLGKQWCCVNGCFGKNFNYFTAPLPPGDTNTDGSRNAIWVQTHPVEPTEVQRMAPCRTVVRPLKLSNSTGHNNTALTRYFVDDSAMMPSFANIGEPYYWSQGIFNHPITEHRGSACCIHMEHPVSGQALLVGISHQKQTGRKWAKLGGRQYTSNFYATSAEPPFSMVALSGSFCLGHPTKSESEMNHLAPLTRNRNFKFGYRLDCPFITFVSTIVDNPHNPDTFIIGYGLNDMISRVVEVKKEDIVAMLFNPFGLNED